MDHTTIHPLCKSQAHHIDLHLWRGPPKNRDATRPIQILVNHGYVVGFCPDRLQPAWSAYRVALAEDDVDYDRPLHYHNDQRLPKKHRIGRRTFGKLGNVPLNVGHMTPNEVINRQFGRLAQMETFLMSNMSPQYGSLNSGVWLKLETAIRKIEDVKDRDHVWVIVGPVFGDQPATINRGRGKHLQVPDAYFCITADPFKYPFDTLSNTQIDCFIIPQDAPGSSNPQDYPATLQEIEERTNLEFFSAWDRDVPVALEQRSAQPVSSRLMDVLEQQEQQWQSQSTEIAEALPNANTIVGLVDLLEAEASAIQNVDRVLTSRESTRLTSIQHTISWLLAAAEITKSGRQKSQAANLITYKVVSDMDGRLKQAARTACNFWNRFVEPSDSIVMRLETFTQVSGTIARAYKPYSKSGVRYGRVQFNTRFLVDFTSDEIAGTIVHELGHTLGMGWDDWMKLFNTTTGKFKSAAIKKLSLLQEMDVELDGGPGTELSHWDEKIFDKELMTGYKDSSEYVLPVTINVMALLGHKIIEKLHDRIDLASLLEEAANMVFLRQDEARELDVDYFEQTDLLEIIPHSVEEE